MEELRFHQLELQLDQMTYFPEDLSIYLVGQ